MAIDVNGNTVKTRRTRREGEPQVHQDTDFRQSDTWDLADVHQDFDASWVQQGSKLPEIPPRPGMEQRWIRGYLGGEPDAERLTTAREEGWKRRDPETVPEYYRALTQKMDGLGSVIGASRMILMERPIKLGDILRRSIREATENQMTSVDENMFKVHERGSGFGPPRRVEDRTTVSVGRPAPMQED